MAAKKVKTRVIRAAVGGAAAMVTKWVAAKAAIPTTSPTTANGPAKPVARAVLS